MFSLTYDASALYRPWVLWCNYTVVGYCATYRDACVELAWIIALNQKPNLLKVAETQ